MGDGQAESEREQAVLLLNSALRATGSSVWCWNVETAEVSLTQPADADSACASDVRSFASWIELIHPDDRNRVVASLEQHVAESTPPIDLDFRARDAADEWHRIHLLGDTIERTKSGRSLRLAGTFRYLATSPQTCIDAHQAIMAKIAQRAPLSDVLTALVLSIERQNPEMIGSILLLDDSQRFLRTCAAPHLPSEYSALVEQWPIDVAVGSCGAAVVHRKRVIVSDVASDPLWLGHRDTAARFGLGACWSEPLISDSGRVLGTFAIYYRRPCAPSTQDLAIIELAAKIAAIAVMQSQSAAALTASQEVLRRALEAGQMGTWDWNIATNVVIWSDMVDALFGLPPGTFSGRYEDYLRLIPEPDREAVTSALHDAISGRSAGFTVVHRVVWPDRSVHWLEGKGRAYRNEEGKPVRMAGTVADVSARKAAEEALRASEERLRQGQKMEAVGRLAGGIAHDFNNLLMAIGGCAQVALELVSSDGRVGGYLHEIQKASERAADLTKQLLAFSRKQRLALRPMDLRSVVREVSILLSRVIGEDIELSTNLPNDLGVVRADPGQIEQLIMNLVVNARDSMPNGGRLILETRNADNDGREIATPGAFVMLSVSDTGHGMDRDTQARMFEPFFTTKETGQGTGLGLATVYGITEQLGGHIVVRSEIGKGSQFELYFPRVEKKDVAMEAPVLTGPGGRARSGETILLVEDEPAVRTLVQRILERQGYSVLAAANGTAALEVQSEHPGPIHLLITDMVLPASSGREVAERIATIRPNIRVLFVSGYSEDRLERAGRVKTGAAFLQKPFANDALTSRVRELLDSREH